MHIHYALLPTVCGLHLFLSLRCWLISRVQSYYSMIKNTKYSRKYVQLNAFEWARIVYVCFFGRQITYWISHRHSVHAVFFFFLFLVAVCDRSFLSSITTWNPMLIGDAFGGVITGSYAKKKIVYPLRTFIHSHRNAVWCSTTKKYHRKSKSSRSTRCSQH